MTSQNKNGHRIGGTLMLSSTGAYGENILTNHKLLKKEDVAV